MEFNSVVEEKNGKSIIFIYTTTDIYNLKDIVEKKLEDEDRFNEKEYMKTIENIKCIKNMYEPESELDIERYLFDLYERQNREIIEKINEQHDFYIIIGHEPIVGSKLKKGKNNLMDISLLEVFDNPNFKDKKIIYLCADIHLYQSGTITLLNSGVIIHQEIVGTGGAQLDRCSSPEPKLFNKYQYEANIYNKDKKYKYEIKSCEPSHGFAILNINNEDIFSEFIQAEDIPLDNNL